MRDMRFNPALSSPFPDAKAVFAFALRPAPLAPLQPLLGVCIHHLARRRREIFVRLGEHAGERYGLDPVDLPFAFMLESNSAMPRLIAVRRLPAGFEAKITGPIESFLGLVSGACSADALFFSRHPAVEGDIEAALALRNAIDDSEIDLLYEIAMLLGPTELQPLERDGLAELDGEMLAIPEDAPPLARVTAALFDAYRDKGDPRYSRVI